MRVLIADDEKAVSGILADVVRSYGHEVVGVVGCGLDAIRSYRRYKPDVVLMDLMMAKYNGATATRMILGSYPSARIILVSGHLRQDDFRTADCGAVATLPKPFLSERLNELLNKLQEESEKCEAQKARQSSGTEMADRQPVTEEVVPGVGPCVIEEVNAAL